MAGQFQEPTRIIGAPRSPLSDDAYRDFARTAITSFVKKEEIDNGQLESSSLKAGELPAGRRQERRGFRQSQAGARHQRSCSGILPGRRAKPVRRHREEPCRARTQPGQCPHRRREADRTRPGLCTRTQRCDRTCVRRAPDLPHRSLSRQGDGAEPDGAALRQHALRAAVELGAYRPCADHRRRDGRAGGSRQLLRQAGALRAGAEPCCSSCA